MQPDFSVNKIPYKMVSNLNTMSSYIVLNMSL